MAIRDEEFYSAVAQELASGQVHQGIWAKALSDSDYDENKAKARYIKLRVRSIKNDLAEQRRNMRLAEQARKAAITEQQRYRGNSDSVNSSRFLGIAAGLVEFVFGIILIIAMFIYLLYFVIHVIQTWNP